MSAYYNDLAHFPCEVLRQQIAAGLLPEGYVDERDIREVHTAGLMGYTHIHLFAGIGAFALGFKRASVPDDLRVITIGFPCKDISNLGSKTGITGPQSQLWNESARILRELVAHHFRPDYIIVENVERLLQRGFGHVLADLASCGFDAQWQVLPAAAFGAPHLRERLFIIAYPGGKGLERAGVSSFLPITLDQPVRARLLSESDVVRERPGVPDYMDRIEALGNSIDVRVAEYVGQCIVMHSTMSVGADYSYAHGKDKGDECEA